MIVLDEDAAAALFRGSPDVAALMSANPATAPGAREEHRRAVSTVG